MIEFADLIMKSGRAAIELALFILLPVMILMLTFMRLLEARGILQRAAGLVSPLLRPFGVPGLGVFALVQVMFVGFAAPLATLALMDRQGTSDRHIAATLAMVFALPQANVLFPMAAVGLEVGMTLLFALAGGAVAAGAAYHLFGRRLSAVEQAGAADLDAAPQRRPRGFYATLQSAGKEGVEIALGSLPMLVLALFLVNLLRFVGAMDGLERLLAPLFQALSLPPATVLAIVTKYIAGGTAMMGVFFEFLREGLAGTVDLNRLAGLLVHPLDLAGVAILMAAGPRVAAVLRPAVLGAFSGIAVRALLHLAWY